jgi:hypothetical protein
MTRLICVDIFGQEVVMEIGEPAKGEARKISDDTLAGRYLDLRRLRDEVRKAEAISVRRNSKRDPRLKTTRASVRLGDQELVDLLS